MKPEVKHWAEAVANQRCKFSDVPRKFRKEVKRLLDKLLDPNAPIPPTTMTNMSYKQIMDMYSIRLYGGPRDGEYYELSEDERRLPIIHEIMLRSHSKGRLLLYKLNANNGKFEFAGYGRDGHDICSST